MTTWFVRYMSSSLFSSNDRLMIFFLRMCKTLFHFLFLKYSAIIFFLNVEFISIKMMMNKASSSSDSKMLNSSFPLTSRNKASDTMCCLSDLCLMITLKRWIYSKARISRRFNLSIKVMTRLVCLTILRANSWSVKRMMNFLEDSIMWRIFLMMKIMSAIFSSMSQ